MNVCYRLIPKQNLPLQYTQNQNLFTIEINAQMGGESKQMELLNYKNSTSDGKVMKTSSTSGRHSYVQQIHMYREAKRMV